MHLAISEQSEQASANVRSVSGRQKNTAHPNDRLSGHSSVDEIISAYRLPRAKRRTRRLPSEIGLTATSEETRKRGTSPPGLSRRFEFVRFRRHCGHEFLRQGRNGPEGDIPPEGKKATFEH